MRVIGIDPGLATTGLGFLCGESERSIEAMDWLTITTKAGIPLPERLLELREDLTGFLRETKPDLAVVEKLFFAANEKTAIDVAHARGTILLTLHEARIPIMEPTPLEMKSCITGDGRADKKQVQSMIMRMLNLAEPPGPDDAADALALAFFGLLRKQHISA